MVQLGGQEEAPTRAAACLVRAAQWIGVTVCAVALAVFAGWAFDIPIVTSLGSRVASMKPATALGLLMGGVALTLLARPRGRGWSHRAAMAASGVMALVGAVCLVMKAAGLDPDPGPATPVVLLQPSWATAAGLLIGGLMLMTSRATGGVFVVVSRAATLVVGLIAAVVLMAYILGVSDLYAMELYRTMALHTAAGLLVLSVGECMAHPERGVVALLLRDDAGGAVARRLMPVVIGVPLLVGMGASAMVDAGVWGPRLGLGVVVVLVVVTGVFAVGTTARSLSIADRARRATERRNRMMVAELDHRVKNTMAAVLSLCEQTAAGCGTIDEFKRTYRGRLQAMARAHDALAATKWQGVSLRTMVTTVVGAYSFIDGRALEVRGEEIVLPGSAALPVAVTLNELATNAVKHGAWSDPSGSGTVRVSWRVIGGEWLEMEWEEVGAPKPVRLNGGGFGVSLIKGMIPHEMGGTVGLEPGPGGMVCRIRLSLAEAARKTEAKFAMVG